MPLALFEPRKQCTLKNYTQQHCYPRLFPKNPYTLAGFKPGSSAPQADTMTTSPRQQGMLLTYVDNIIFGTQPRTLFFQGNAMHIFCIKKTFFSLCPTKNCICFPMRFFFRRVSLSSEAKQCNGCM
jgi:hypothetical protein